MVLSCCLCARRGQAMILVPESTILHLTVDVIATTECRGFVLSRLQYLVSHDSTGRGGGEETERGYTQARDNRNAESGGLLSGRRC